VHVAFLHNLQTSPVPEQAEFDTPETVKAITQALENLGHKVTPIDAATSLPLLVTRLQMVEPDLVLNTAEGSHGRGREGFYPGLLEQMGLCYTGSDAYVCTVTLDKQLTNLALAKAGLRVPRSLLVNKVGELKGCELQFPVIAKPNFEGSSKGITQDSIATDLEQLERVVKVLLHDYPSGVLIEEFIEGRDVTVPFIEGVGVLEPAHYEFSGEQQKYSIYDFELKQNRPDDVHVICPALISPATRKQLHHAAKKAIEILKIRDLCRIDFRVNGEGEAFLIEVNALPSLEPGAAIYLAAQQSGLTSVEEALSAILKSAAKRMKKRPGGRGAPKVKVGVIHNLKRADVSVEDDREAEFDSKATVDALCQAVEDNGFEAVPLEARPELPSELKTVDLAFNIAEGRRGRYRESQIPALLELMDIPFTGSEAGALAICHDKGLAKRLVAQAGVITARSILMTTGEEKLDSKLRFPLMVKPVAEGSSKGVALRSVVRDEKELREVVKEMVGRYRQPALVEEYLSGREFTVGLLGEKKLRVLPVLEIIFKGDDPHPIYSFQHKQGDDALVKFQVPAELEPALQKKIEKAARDSFHAARVDFRMDNDGELNFIECNPLPGLSPGYSDLCVIGAAGGLSYTHLVGQIMAPAVRRYKLKKKGALSV